MAAAKRKIRAGSRKVFLVVSTGAGATTGDAIAYGGEWEGDVDSATRHDLVDDGHAMVIYAEIPKNEMRRLKRRCDAR